MANLQVPVTDIEPGGSFEVGVINLEEGQVAGLWGEEGVTHYVVAEGPFSLGRLVYSGKINLIAAGSSDPEDSVEVTVKIPNKFLGKHEA